MTMKLICPICKEALQQINKSAVCANHHTFDYAKQGYLNLLLRQSVDHGDNAAMVKARTAFLNTGSYAFLRQRLCEIMQANPHEVLADLGCGEGYYTSAFPAKEKYGFDMSREALRHAARTDHSTQYAVASIFHLPLPESSCDIAVTCFAPFAKGEIERILKKNGIFIFVTPGPRHLFEMKEAVYETPYENEMKDLDTKMEVIQDEMIENQFTLDQDQLFALFMMTPYAHRTREEDREKLKKYSSLTLTAQFRIRVYKNL